MRRHKRHESSSGGIDWHIVYASMKSHKTPIPTPIGVRFFATIFLSAATLIMGTDLPHIWQVVGLIACVAAALAVVFFHPYRAQMRAYIESKDASFSPHPASTFLPLFPIWLELMILPLVAPLSWPVLAVAFVVTFWWLWICFPHVDGTRPLAFI